MRAIFVLALGLFAAAPPFPAVQDPVQSGGEKGGTSDLAVRAHKLYVGNGQVQEDVILLIRDGKVLRIEKDTGTVPAGFTAVDARNRVVIPGLVCADSELAVADDDPYTVTPDVLAVEAFDFNRSRARELAGGVTTAYLSPSRNRLISGQGSAVKLAGKDPASRVVSESVALRVALNDEGKTSLATGQAGAPPVFEPVVTPSSDHPLLPARIQYPTARLSQAAELRRIFNEAVTAPNGNALGMGPEEMHYEAETLRSVPQGKLPLRIAASSASDIRRAITFAKSISAAAVIEDGAEAAKVAGLLAAAGIPVVLRVPVRPGAHNPGDLLPGRDQQPLPDPAAAGELSRAGVRIALAPSLEGDAADLLLLAGVAVRSGLSPAAALSAVTLDAARVLRVDSRVGSLEAGKDADLLFLTGEPFDGRTVVERVYVEGREAFRRERTGSTLVVRAGRILVGDGTEIRNGVVVIENGKIVSVSSGSALPFGADVIDEPDGVVMPGLIDASSRLGLHAEGNAGLTASSRIDVSSVVRPGDPVFGLALESGVTTVLVSGDDSGALSGRVSAIKTAGTEADQIVLRKTSGLRFVHDGIGTTQLEALRAELNRGKGYADRFKAWEEAVKAFKEGRGKKPEKEEPKPADAKADPISGEWKGQVTVGPPIPRPLDVTLKLKLEGEAVTGTINVAMGPQGSADNPVTGTFSGTTVKLTANSPLGEMTLTAEVAGDEMTGAFRVGPLAGTFTVKRTSGADAQASTDVSGEPKEPQVDQALEPYRELFAGRIPAVVRTSKARAIHDVVKVFRDEFKLPLVLVGADDVVEEPSLVQGKDVGVQVGPQLVERRKGKLVNVPARLAYAGVPVAFQTENAAGSRWLPIHAIQAVRNGLDPDAALRAMTSASAKMYKLDDRIGTLARGKDGDLVVLSGDPFDLTTQVRAVVVNGRIALDKRK